MRQHTSKAGHLKDRASVTKLPVRCRLVGRRWQIIRAPPKAGTFIEERKRKFCEGGQKPQELQAPAKAAPSIKERAEKFRKDEEKPEKLQAQQAQTACVLGRNIRLQGYRPKYRK